MLTWSSPGSYSPFSPAGLQGSIGCWHTSCFTGCERACGIPNLLPEPLQEYPCVDALLLGLLHMDTVQNQFLYCQWRSVVLVILLLLFSLHLKFLDNVAQDISLKSLQSSSAGLQSIHQWVQDTAKDVKRISEGTARGIFVLNLRIMVCSYCSASVCCLSPWQ